MIGRFKKGFFLILSIFLFFLVTNTVFGFEIKNIGAEIRDDFVLEPIRMDISIDPGEERVEFLKITNRTDEKKVFNVEIEDFSGSNDPNTPVVLMGSKKGPFSLKDYVIPEINDFVLESGEQMVLPIKIKTADEATPGGLYGTVLVSSASQSTGGTGATTVSRLGSLFFVRVNGEVFEDGSLEDFRIKSGKEFFYGESPSKFEVLFENKGSVHLNPYGSIKILNLFGSVIDEISIEEYFSMPDSLRYREIDWKNDSLFGRYTALISLNRGYGDLIDEKKLVFWVFSGKIFIFGLIILLAMFFIGKKVFSRG